MPDRDESVCDKFVRADDAITGSRRRYGTLEAAGQYFGQRDALEIDQFTQLIHSARLSDSILPHLRRAVAGCVT